MKLYTEEQVIELTKAAFTAGQNNNQFIFGNKYDGITPIELPSDEEIENQGKWVFNDKGHTIYTHYNTVPSWIEGAKYLRDKIQGGNK